MRKLREFLSRFVGLFNRRRQDQDLAEQLESHLQFHIEDNLRAGLSPAEARRQAILQLGGLDSTKEACRDQCGLPFLESLWMDLRYAARQLRRNPAFAAVAALTLALGIGANTVVFSVAKAVLFRPLGFAEEDGLMWLQLVNTQTGAIEDRFSWREMEGIRENTRSFEAIGTFGASGARWQQGDRAEIHEQLDATPQLPAILRVRPVLGRKFETADAARSSPPVAMIGYELWQSRFDGASNIIGQTARIEDKTRTIIGVLPPGLEFPMERAPKLGTGGALVPGIRSFWTPMPEPEGPDLTARQNRMFLPVARLKPGVTEAAARAELATLGQRLAKDHPESNRHTTFTLVSFRDQILGQTRRAIPLLAIAVAGVLLICCVNLANLILARSLARQRELAVRLALGADRSRIVRALMIESLLLAALGGALGIFFAHISLATCRFLQSQLYQLSPRNPLLLGAVSLLVLLASLAASAWPATRAARTDPMTALRAE
jgi:predicted permease